MRDRGQQQIIFDVEDARRVVGAFEKGADAREIIAVVAQHRPPEGAAHQSALLADRGEHIGQIILEDLPLQQRAESSEAQTSELRSLMRISYAVFGVNNKQKKNNNKSF